MTPIGSTNYQNTVCGDINDTFTYSHSKYASI